MRKYLLAIVIVLAFVLSGCASKMEAEYDMEEYNASQYNDENTELKDPEPVVVEDTNQGGDVTNDSEVPALENRKIIYRADLVMAVLDPAGVYNDVLTTVDTYTAYIEEADIDSNTYEVTIRVLSTEFEDLVEDIKTEGELVSYSKTSEDITNTYSTFEAKYEALETRHTRILELIAQAEDLDTILMLEEERYEIEAELNAIGRTLANYDSLVDYSTITLLIKEAKEEIIVLPRTEIPNVWFNEITTNSIEMEVYNTSDNNITLNIDVYNNGEFVTEYEENMFSDSKTIVLFEDLDSNQEYTFKITALADDHRVSLQDTLRRETEKTYTNRTTNTFLESVNLLVLFFEFLGLAISGILPFAITGAVIYIPLKIFVLNKRKGKTTETPVDKEE